MLLYLYELVYMAVSAVFLLLKDLISRAFCQTPELTFFGFWGTGFRHRLVQLGVGRVADQASYRLCEA